MQKQCWTGSRLRSLERPVSNRNCVRCCRHRHHIHRSSRLQRNSCLTWWLICIWSRGMIFLSNFWMKTRNKWKKKQTSLINWQHRRILKGICGVSAHYFCWRREQWQIDCSKHLSTRLKTQKPTIRLMVTFGASASLTTWWVAPTRPKTTILSSNQRNIS